MWHPHLKALIIAQHQREFRRLILALKWQMINIGKVLVLGRYTVQAYSFFARLLGDISGTYLESHKTRHDRVLS